MAGILKAEFATNRCDQQNGGLSRVIFTENGRHRSLGHEIYQ